MDEQNTITGEWHGCHSKNNLSKTLDKNLQSCAILGGVAISPRPSEKGAPILAGKPMRPLFGIDTVLLDDKVVDLQYDRDHSQMTSRKGRKGNHWFCNTYMGQIFQDNFYKCSQAFIVSQNNQD